MSAINSFSLSTLAPGGLVGRLGGAPFDYPACLFLSFPFHFFHSTYDWPKPPKREDYVWHDK